MFLVKQLLQMSEIQIRIFNFQNCYCVKYLVSIFKFLFLSSHRLANIVIQITQRPKGPECLRLFRKSHIGLRSAPISLN